MNDITLVPGLDATDPAAWSPLNPPLPARFRQAQRISMLLELTEGRVAALVPPPLTSMGDFAWITWLNARDVDGFLCTNFSINLPVTWREHTGKHCALEYINFGHGMSTGREMLAYPKKGAEFSWTEAAEGIAVECTRAGAPIARVTALFDDDPAADLDWASAHGAPDIGVDTLQVRNLASDYMSDPEVAQVEKVTITNATSWEPRPARGSLEFINQKLDDFDPLGPFTVLATRVDRQEFDLGHNTILGRHHLGSRTRMNGRESERTDA